jgi:hypothetical protein
MRSSRTVKTRPWTLRSAYLPPSYLLARMIAVVLWRGFECVGDRCDAVRVVQE